MRLESANCADQLAVKREDRPPDAEGEVGVAAGQDGVSRAENEDVVVDEDPAAEELHRQECQLHCNPDLVDFNVGGRLSVVESDEAAPLWEIESDRFRCHGQSPTTSITAVAKLLSIMKNCFKWL
jgi:hypothetical protein